MTRISSGGERLEELEREDRELRRANESLTEALQHALCGMAFGPSGSGARDARASALEGEASWETVPVPHGAAR